MGYEEVQALSIPVLDFRRDEGLVLKQGSEEWKAMCNKVREACENHGCFVVMEDEILPMNLREEMMMGMKALFDLPEETKQKHTSPRPYQSYEGNSPVVPLHESFGFDNVCQLDAAQAFTNLMWPQGNPAFCETMKSMSSKMVQLNLTILEMILESLNMGKHYKSHMENTNAVFRLMKYKLPPANDTSADVVGLVPHTDKSALTVLCQNDVQGLEVETKQGEWVKLMVPEGGVVVFVGDVLKAWSNGRLHAVTHRVMMTTRSGVHNKEARYSCAVFGSPKQGVTIQVPVELVDKDHPLLYRPFNFGEYLAYFTKNTRADALELYAGV